MRHSLVRFLSSPAAALMLALSALASAPFASAHGGSQHPVTINAGSCAELGEVVIPLGDAGDHLPIDGVESAGEHQGAESAVPVDGSLTKVSLAITDLIGQPHSIAVHASADDIDTVIACGDIGGLPMGTQFPVGLAEVNGSGTWGVAILQDNGDGTTQIGIYVVKDETAEHDNEEAGDHHDHAEGTPIT
jgi:hypothetical protein